MDSLSAIAKLPLFAGIDASAALRDLSAREGNYAAGETLLRAGERCESVGILLSGGADVVREDAGGNPEIGRASCRERV